MKTARHYSSKTKVIATIGPATSSKELLGRLFNAGTDACRLNFSHGNYNDHLMVINHILELNREMDHKVAILADLQGPKLRIGEVENNEIELIEGREISFVSEKCMGNPEKVFLSYEAFAKDAVPGEAVLLDDGKIKLRVIETNRKDRVRLEVIYGGKLSSKKGVNLPDTKISLPSLTKKDIEDVRFILDHEVDWIALSFVRSATDILELKEIIKKKKKNVKVIAKIEKPEALEQIDNIIDVSDAVMIARGDLGAELSFERVPLIQKQIINKCIQHAKPVIVATQMLESMISNFRPTRAEASDVANAVFDGADTLMLSGETSVGKYPLEAIKAMQNVIDYAEGKEFVLKHEYLPDSQIPSFLPDSVCYNACKMADLTNATAIITFTHSGATAFKISSHRPKADIFVFTSNESLIRKLSIVWGVHAFYMPHEDHINEAVSHTIEFLKTNKYIRTDDVVIHVGSIPMKNKGKTNMMKISYV
ncbi:MAG TPA: pyruvate kinase [Bacteroidales bacterium]|nr:pyruvate kinase [Bacteroidales bacterium]